MLRIVSLVLLLAAVACGEDNATTATSSVLWKDPGDISKRDIIGGPGGREHQPAAGPVKFLKEDTHGYNLKFDVDDAAGKKWKVKPGPEAQVEVAVTRLLWSVGYFADEDYIVPDLQVQKMPKYMSRDQRYIKDHHEVINARLERHPKKVGKWSWRKNPFSGTREFDGLRVMMALVNSWDLKDDNNSIYDDKDGEREYAVSDLGSALGKTQVAVAGSKNNLKAFAASKFITHADDRYVDFGVPTAPSLLFALSPIQYIHKLRQRWIGRHIPREHVEWVTGLLGQLSDEQIRDAFRAANYSDAEVEGFAKTIEARIAQLKGLQVKKLASPAPAQ